MHLFLKMFKCGGWREFLIPRSNNDGISSYPRIRLSEMGTRWINMKWYMQSFIVFRYCGCLGENFQPWINATWRIISESFLGNFLSYLQSYFSYQISWNPCDKWVVEFYREIKHYQTVHCNRYRFSLVPSRNERNLSWEMCSYCVCSSTILGAILCHRKRWRWMNCNQNRESHFDPTNHLRDVGKAKFVLH